MDLDFPRFAKDRSILTLVHPVYRDELAYSLQVVNRVLKRIPGPVLGTRFGGFCEWYLRFGCPKHDPGAAQDRPDSVCLSV